MKKIEVCPSGDPSFIWIGKGLFEEGAFCETFKNQRLFVFLDANVPDRFQKAVFHALRTTDHQIKVVRLSESEKQWPLLLQFWEWLVERDCDRDSVLMSVGGGVLNDMVGFAAACYLRGISWITVPTTLLAQVDAALGGKTGIDFGGVKNVLGAIHQPRSVFCEMSFLDDLPHRQFRSGLAEVVKYGMALDSKFFGWLENNRKSILERQPTALEYLVEQSCIIKSKVVERDEKDQGFRHCLNFGHTFAHAIESATQFKVFSHGEAVSIGMCLASHVARQLQWVPQELINRLENLLKFFGLPCSLPTLTLEKLQPYLQQDKKRRKGRLHFVLPRKLGHVEVTTNVPWEALEQGFQMMNAYVKTVSIE